MMIIAIHLVFAAAAIYCAGIGLYLLIVTLAAFGVKTRPRASLDFPSCAVIIPAHNEASQIRRTLERVYQSNYPKDCFHVYVIADNCDDDTALISRALGAAVLERFDTENRGKGQALDWCFHNHAEILRTHASCVIIDADSMVDPGFLASIMASLLEPGVAAVQSNNSAANPLENWRAALTSAAFALVNCVRPAGLARLGASVGLKGNGMAFRSDILARYGWPAHSIVEDIEFGVRLLLDGHRTVFDFDAKICSDMPTNRLQADSQRRRWEFGRFQVACRFVPILVRALLAERSFRHLGTLMELIVPPLSVLVLIEAAFLALVSLVHPFWAAVFGLCAAMTVLHVALGLHYCRMPGRVWLALLAAPAFLLWKVILYAGIILTRGQQGWVRTLRTGELPAKTLAHPAREDDPV